MKRMLSATLISLAFLLSLSGCTVIPIYKNFDLNPETVSSVQIYDLRLGDSYYDDFLSRSSSSFTRWRSHKRRIF